MQNRRSFDLSRAEDMLDALLDKHDRNLDLAKGFGVRTAALPKNLMPLKQAQQIVASFETDTKQLNAFVNSLHAAGKAPAGMEAEFKALLNKATLALGKFEVDRANATKAIEKYEDLLVGEHFQTAFEAVRHAVLDFDLADDIDIDFKTTLKLDAEPSHASGEITLSRGSTMLMWIVVGYRASDDMYYGNLQNAQTRKAFYSVVSKIGSTKLPAFVRELSEQAKAVSESWGLNLFKSRKKVELKLVDQEVYKAPLTEAIKQVAKVIYGHDPQNLVIKMVSDTKATASFDYNGYGWTENIEVPDVQWKIKSSETKRKALNAPQSGAMPNGAQWTSKGLDDPWWYRTRLTTSNFTDYEQFLGFYDFEQFLGQLPELMNPKVYGMSAADLRKMAVKYRVDPSSIGATKDSKFKAIAAMLKVNGLSTFVKDLRLNRADVKWDITITPPSKKASAKHVAQRFLTAGASSFYNYVRDPNVAAAFLEARKDYQRESERSEGYSGTIAEKNSYKIRNNDPMTLKEAEAFADRDANNNDKWGPAYAVPVAEEKVLKKEMITVAIEARDEAEAKKRGINKIKATGRIPPDATILVDLKKVTLTAQSARTKVFEITGERRASITGKTTGWYFYGFASS